MLNFRLRWMNLLISAILTAVVVSTPFGCASTKSVPNAPLDRAWWAQSEDQDAVTDKPSGEISISSIYLTMRDGVRIAVDVYLPSDLKQGETIPAILTQTRYWRSMHIRWPASAFVKTPEELLRIVGHGYAVVRADARGSGASFGVRPCPWSADEIRDGAEIVDWIVRQSWSDGTVGATGGSYEGTAAEFLMINRHPDVKALAPLFSLYDTYTDIAFPGGIHLEWFTRVWQDATRSMDLNRPGEFYWWAEFVTSGVKPVDADFDRSLLKAAVKDHGANYLVHQEAMQLTFRDDTSAGGMYTDRFSPHSYIEDARASGAAIYNYSGWFDGAYPHAAIKRFLTVRNPGSKLVLGPWDHGGDDHVRPFGEPVKARFDHLAELGRFFDHYLKGIDTGIADEPPVHYYTMAEDAWKSVDSWPPEAQVTSFYMAEGNALSTAPPQDTAAFDTYTVDLTAGTGQISRWNCLIDEVAVNYPDRREQDEKLLIYTSAPLDADTEVTGHPIVTLQVVSTEQDGEFFVYLEDVDPQGRVNYVTEGMLRAIHRKLSDREPPYRTPVPYRTFKREDALPLVPGEVAELTFDLLPVSYLFRKGHGMRVAIAGADADHFRILPGEPPTLQVHRSAAHASRIDLPVVPRQ